MPRAARFVTFAVGLCLLAGCILFVSPDDFGEHCAFAGRTSDCGTCIATRCQGEIDACCRDGACASTLGAVEGCAAANDDRCIAVRDARTSGGSAGALATCVTSRCGGVCAKFGGESQTRCDEPALIRGLGCSCQLSAPGTDFACGVETFPETVCCAPAGWPAPGLVCACLPIGCLPTADGCLCSRIDYENSGTVCAGAICCASEDGCGCGTRPCQSSQRRVAACTRAEIGCPRGQTMQTSCSIP